MNESHRAALDDYEAEMETDRLKRDHDLGTCNRDKCEFCLLEELGEAVLEHQKGE